MSDALAAPTHHQTLAALGQAIARLRRAPAARGVVHLVVQRPAENVRNTVDAAEFSVTEGLVGDTWRERRSRRTTDGSPHPDMQITLMSTWAIRAISPDEARWPLAGDQLFVDLDLTYENLPPGTRLQAGEVVFEVTSQPHTGCDKFVARFGLDAMTWVNSTEGRSLNLRGIYAKVVTPGRLRRGDAIVRCS